MNELKDDLTLPEAYPALLERLAYATGMQLDADDFLREQLYHRGRLARALALVAGKGTVAGLFVKTRNAGDPANLDRAELVVAPGIAIDGAGRLVEVTVESCLRLQRWYDAQDGLTQSGAWHQADADNIPADGVVADLFLAFRPCARGKTPSFASGPFDATDALEHARVLDGAELALVVRRDSVPKVDRPRADLRALTSEQDRAKFVRDRVYAAWPPKDDALVPHGAGIDPTAVLIARVVLETPEPAAGARPAWSGDVTVDNDLRPFSLGAGVLAGRL